jgi:beta-lactamase superfamily II metal-dependent hydrolase
MTDFYEIDFLDVESNKSGDAIAMRYVINGITTIHITDGGYQDTGIKLAEHIQKYYDAPAYIDHVVATHNDGDHAGGLRHILETYEIGELWMHRPWLYADDLIDRFQRFTNVENLKTRLKEVYPNLAALEEIAIDRGIPIREPFQGKKIGAFTVMSPSKDRYLDLVVDSEKTPESVNEAQTTQGGLASLFAAASTQVVKFITAMWGDETFSNEETSAENEMSVVQYAVLNNKKILLTGDTGRAGLAEAAEFAPTVGLALPGIDKFQVPHHGSRRNVSSEALDHWLGPKLKNDVEDGKELFTAIISSAKKDKDHPRHAVVRAMIHRGGYVITTEGRNIRTSSSNAPEREGWSKVAKVAYPNDQES